MKKPLLSRRNLLKAAGATAAFFPAKVESQTQRPPEPAGPTTSTVADRDRREQWWHQARFGMFIHFGLYSVLGRHEWAMENEGIPVAEYEQLAKRFNPKPHAARAWARLAKAAGMKYMVMTTKHHEGFCLFNTKLTNYCAPKQAAGRDLVAEYVEAARGEGMHVGFYYSLMDWHHPDGARCATDEAARRRFVDYTHGLVRELCTNYGKLDILWYDVNWPLTPEGWESVKMNEMVRKLQPDILINNRSGIPEDFTTPEQHIQAFSQPWEACMTMNDSWGYQRADDDWKSPKTIVRNLLTCTRDGGNYLLNIGPKGDGSIPEPSTQILTAVGQWMDKHGDLIHKADRCQMKRSDFALFTRQGNTLYMHVYFWPGSTVALGGLQQKVLSAKLYPTGEPVKFDQEQWRVRLTGLPETAPDPIATVLQVECDGEPTQDMLAIRKYRKRDGV
ncbi:MAG TPA: alpha-L-fucosidase [Bryobacteraceae bacterium]|jgi:alpha-L-fucosidase|nr:alpha-L-fucosidase [Bryobacteraceae bacterium]